MCIPIAVRALYPHTNVARVATRWAGERLAQTVGWRGFQILHHTFHLLHYAALNHLEILARHLATRCEFLIHLGKFLIDL